MIQAEYIYSFIEDTKKDITKSIHMERYEDALCLISACASVLYKTNIYYEDDFLENALKTISDHIELDTFHSKSSYCSGEEFILFYDGFGLNDRGLIQIYLKALCKIKKVVYVSYEERKDLIPDIHKILDRYNCERKFIIRARKTNIDQILQLNEIIKEYRPQKLFFYSVPNDVIAPTVMYAYGGFITRYQINLTDHAFWLGAGCIDKCIEFRNYGAKISKEYRKIEEDKIVIIPYYPILHREKNFQGYPFIKGKHQKVVFSGGSLYKTIGGDNKYYEIVDHILKTHKDTFFWYAGSGDDSEMKTILRNYPDRAFLTGERSDLLQVLEHCDVYLSTYPLCGGLMFQYAAIAGRVPVTLVGEGNVSEGFLIDQEMINVEFGELESLYAEIDKLLTDEEYAKKRSELMKRSVPSSDDFDEEVQKLINGEKSDSFQPKFEHIDTKAFRDWYLEGLVKADVDAMIVSKKDIRQSMMHYPLRFLRGGIHLAKKKLPRYLSTMLHKTNLTKK